MNHLKETRPLERLAWGIKEAAAASGVSPSFIRKAINGTAPNVPQLKIIRLGRRVLIRDSVLKEWIGLIEPSKAP